MSGNALHMTSHAAKRCQQRGIPLFVLDLLLKFGVSEPAGDGTRKLFFDKAARRQVKTYLGRFASAIVPHLDIYALVSNEDRVITAAHRLARIERH